MKDVVDYFTKCYVAPIKNIKELPDGNGGFVAFIIGFVLYERLVGAKLKSKKIKASEENRRNEISQDLNLTTGQTMVFIEMFRNGLLHQGMPKVGGTSYAFHHLFGAKPIFRRYKDRDCICINPWKFTERVLDEFIKNPELINSSESYPFPFIGELPKEFFDNLDIDSKG